ncbi:junctional cadherin 5-associated protein [Antennarius striatus]|uniref:junctional cadherin 5-associated protein n=1 Tax=Antennarius striatus TaxID=241820 RepID=UPI0035B3A0DE
MYSVEDLLISHGYKLPKHAPTSSTPAPASTISSNQAPPSSPPSYSKHHEILENMPGSKTVNGYERGSGVPYGNGGGTRQPQSYGGCPNNNNDPRDRSLSRREVEGRGQIDTHSLGESLTSDSGFCDGTRGHQSKDVSYWRRRGQDFTVLLDYADFRESHGGGQREYSRQEGPQQARGQELSAEERQRAAQERQLWAAQAQAQVQAHTRSRDRDAALHQWRTVTERKCQSLGTDEWRPVVSFGRQLSQSEGERWAAEQQRLHARTPEGMVVQPRTKVKSQSLPRMLQPESLQYVDMASSGQDLYRRVNGHPFSHHDLYRAPRWPENGRPASATQISMTPKPRFTRPPRPPSYEMHQQIRGSCEVLSGRDSVTPQARDRTPIPISTGDLHLDYFAQDSRPPGYIPPPSYKRAPIMGGGRRGYGEIAIDHRYKGGVYHQIQVAPDGSHWFTRHPIGFWPDPQRERVISGQKQLYPVYTTQEHPGGGIQYIPFDDPRIRHISSALGGNSLTDADKIRHIRNELPSVTVSEPASNDSAFLPPPLGPFIAAKLSDDGNHKSSRELDNDNNRWHSDLHKETVDNFPATDQNCNNRYPKNQRPPPSPSSAFQMPLKRTSSHQGYFSDQVFAETITQVKKIVPDSGPDNNRNTKRRVSETIFCLVSVPVHTPTNIHKDLADQNNNETMLGLTVPNTETFAVGLKESLNVRSKSVNEMPIRPHYSHFDTSSTSSMRNYKRAPLRKEIIDAWALQANQSKDLCYAGSWPGNQYRNQETQTGSPLTVVKSPEHQSPPAGQEPAPSMLDTTADSRLVTDTNTSFGYPMAGQKDLHLSYNSAFSRLNLSPTHTSSHQPSQQSPTSPSKAHDQRDQQPSSPKKTVTSPSESAEQVTFGQFLLQPVNRRPCDAIGELESINKEMEDTISKRPSVGFCIEGLNLASKRLEKFRPGAHFPAGPEPGREAISLPPMHIEQTSNLKVRSESLASTDDLDSMDLKNTFSGSQVNGAPPSNELLRDCLLPSPITHNESNRIYRQDIPVPQESLLRDVGLTVYTETPGDPMEPMQSSLSIPSPDDHKNLSQSVQQWGSMTKLAKQNSSPEHNSIKELQANMEPEQTPVSDNVQPLRVEVNLSICRSRSEGSSSPEKLCPSRITRLNKEVSFLLDDGDDRYSMSEPLIYKNESTIADRHLESLLIQEKANSLPTEDLSNLYEVKYGKGIPENESIEQRAARILGISVPVEALGVADKQSGDNQFDNDTVDEKTQNHTEEPQQVIGEREQVKEDTLTVQGEETEQIQETESESGHKHDRQKHSSNQSDGEDDEDAHVQSLVVLDLPEFPPSKLPLSLPVTTDEKLALSICSVEKRGRGVACKLIESLQDKLNTSASAASLSRSSNDRMARLKELDSVTRIRQLSLKASESEEKDSDREESVIQEKTKEKVVEREADKDKLDEEKGKEEKTPDEHENAYETRDKLGQPEEVCNLEEETIEELCKKQQIFKKESEGMNVEIALVVENEGCKEVLELKTKQQDGEVELRIVENDNVKLVEELRGGQNTDPDTAELSRSVAMKCFEGEKLPKPKQRTRMQKPPLLPKPRSVPKREITLPLSFSSGTCGPLNMEDEEMLSVSDSYDPSRVERV